MAESNQRGIMKDTEGFIKAYHDFKKSVDFTQTGIPPELDYLIGFILMGVPKVPADADPTEDGPLSAIDQRVCILKAVFVEVNREQPEEFIDQGLVKYDEAGKIAKILLRQTSSTPDSDQI